MFTCSGTSAALKESSYYQRPGGGAKSQEVSAATNWFQLVEAKVSDPSMSQLPPAISDLATHMGAVI